MLSSRGRRIVADVGQTSSADFSVGGRGRGRGIIRGGDGRFRRPGGDDVGASSSGKRASDGRIPGGRAADDTEPIDVHDLGSEEGKLMQSDRSGPIVAVRGGTVANGIIAVVPSSVVVDDSQHHCPCCSGLRPEMIHRWSQTEPLGDDPLSGNLSGSPGKHDPLGGDLSGCHSISATEKTSEKLSGVPESQLKRRSMENADQKMCIDDEFSRNDDRLIVGEDKSTLQEEGGQSLIDTNHESKVAGQARSSGVVADAGKACKEGSAKMNDLIKSGNYEYDAGASLRNGTGNLTVGLSIDMIRSIMASTIAGKSLSTNVTQMKSNNAKAAMAIIPTPSWRLVESVDPTLIDPSTMNFEDDDEEDVSDDAYARRHAPLELAERREWERSCGYSYGLMSLRSGDHKGAPVETASSRWRPTETNDQSESGVSMKKKANLGDMLQKAAGGHSEFVGKQNPNGAATRKNMVNAVHSGKKRCDLNLKKETVLPKIENQQGKSRFREQRRLNFEAEIYRKYQTDELRGGGGGSGRSSVVVEHQMRKTRNSVAADYKPLPVGIKTSSTAVVDGGQTSGPGAASRTVMERSSAQSARKRSISGAGGTIVNKPKQPIVQPTSSTGETSVVASSLVNLYRPRKFPLSDAEYRRMLADNPPGHQPYPPSPPSPTTPENAVARRTQPRDGEPSTRSGIMLTRAMSVHAEPIQTNTVATLLGVECTSAIGRLPNTQATAALRDIPVTPRTSVRNRSTTTIHTPND